MGKEKNHIFLFWKPNLLESPYQKVHESISLFMTNLIVKGTDYLEKFCFFFFFPCTIQLLSD